MDRTYSIPLTVLYFVEIVFVVPTQILLTTLTVYGNLG